MRELFRTKPIFPIVNVNVMYICKTEQGFAKPPGQSARKPPFTHSDHVNKACKVQFYHQLSIFNLHTEQNVNGCCTRRFHTKQCECCSDTVQPERNARTKFSYNQFANLVAFGLHVNLARIWPNWLKTKFSPGVSFWLYCMSYNDTNCHLI